MNMKKIIWKIAVLIGVVTLLSVSVASCSQKDPIPGDSDDNEQTGGDNPGENPGENPGDEEYGKLTGDEKVKAFFVNQIADGDWSYSDDKTVEKESVEEVRDAVWKLWKSANLTYQDEEKLPSLPVLGSSKDVFSWVIPKALEGEYINGSFTGNDSKMTFHWGKSSSLAKPEGGYPVFIYLHGSGGPSSEWNTGYSFCQGWARSVSGIYFDPLIPNGVTDGGFSLYRWWQKGKQYVWNRLIRQLYISTYANPDRLFFVGASEGAYGSARLATIYADYLAGIGPMAGGEPLVTAPVENCANIAYYLMTGSEDNGYGRNLITKYTKEALDALSSEHSGYYDHNVIIAQGKHHSDIDYVSPLWLKDKVRKPYPKYVNWERLDQDGIYREGFYNLFIPDGGKPSDRRQYEMTISGNVIDIKVSSVSYTPVQWAPEPYNNAVRYDRTSTTVSGGKIRIYLCDELVDLDQAVVVKVNGIEVFNGKLERRYETVVNSCAIYFDPSRLYTSSVEVDY